MKEPEKHIETSEIFSRIAKERHSGRLYDASKPVSREDLLKVVEAGRWTPSCYGEEPWRFIICEKSQGASYDAVLKALVPFNQKWAQDAPVLIVVACDTFFSHNNKKNDWAAYDTGAAAQTMALAAQASGLMLHSMGGFDPAPLVSFFHIPDTCRVMAVMALGYEAKSAEAAPRTRKPLETRFFFETWNA